MKSKWVCVSIGDLDVTMKVGDEDPDAYGGVSNNINQRKIKNIFLKETSMQVFGWPDLVLD